MQQHVRQSRCVGRSAAALSNPERDAAKVGFKQHPAIATPLMVNRSAQLRGALPCRGAFKTLADFPCLKQILYAAAHVGRLCSQKITQYVRHSLEHGVIVGQTLRILDREEAQLRPG